MSRVSPGIMLVALIACLSLGCPKPEAPRPAAPVPASAPISEPADCAPCHAEVVARWTGSAHRLASRSTADATPPMRARIAADAPILPAGRDVATFRDEAPLAMMAGDASGATEARPMTRIIGGIRREDFLSPRGDRLHVLPLSWSVTRNAWTDPSAEEQGVRVDLAGPLGWTSRLRDHATSCSRCHPSGATDRASGMTCATCHGDAATHVTSARAAKVSGTSLGREDTGLSPVPSDPWRGCGPCHAVGSALPRTRDARPAGALLDALLPDTLMLAEGLNPAFALDGRPIVPHGREVQSLAQSACASKGGAHCLTCHDPHGGDRTSLKEPDPDASCRTCHAEIAKDAATHARHPVTTQVPVSRDEPAGPAPPGPDGKPPEGFKPRLPGCVDCHMPALLAFSPGDRVRDHAVDVPDPGASARTGRVDACTACHPTWPLPRLAAHVKQDEIGSRRRRGEAFEGAVRFATSGRKDEAARDEALSAVLDVLADADTDPWTRASAAMIVGGLGRGRADLAPKLEEAWRTTEDPVLRRAIARSHAAVAGPPDGLAALMTGSSDWRVRLAAAAALASRRDPRGLEEIDTLRRDASLPDAAHSEAAFEMGVALVASGASGRGEALLLEALGLAPDHVAAWVNLGVARATMENEAGAREAWLRALELAPANVVARANLQALEESRER